MMQEMWFLFIADVVVWFFMIITFVLFYFKVKRVFKNKNNQNKKDDE